MKQFQRGLAFVLSLCMCLSLMSLSAFAEEDGSTQEPPAAPNVAKIGDKEYATLAEAISAAGTGDTVELLGGEDITSCLSVTKSMTIDGSALSTKPVIHMSAEGATSDNDWTKNRTLDISDTTDTTLTLKGISFEGKEAAVISTGASYQRGISLYGNTNVTLNLDDVHVSSAYYAINVAGKNQGVAINMKNSSFADGWAGFNAWSPAKITVENSLIGGLNDKTYGESNTFATIVMNYQDENVRTAGSELSFTNSTITGETTNGNGQWLVDFRDDGIKAEFTGCTFESKGTVTNQKVDLMFVLCEKEDVTFDNCTFKRDGKSLTVDEVVDAYLATYAGNKMSTNTVKFIEGKVTRQLYVLGDAWYLGSGVQMDGDNKITGGTFNADPTAYLADGCAAVKTGSGYVVVKDGGSYDANKDAYVAKIGSAGYTTLAAAFGAARANDTITLTQDCETGSKYTIAEPLYLTAKGATLDLNKKTITVTKNFSFLIQGDGITVKNGLIRAGSNSNSSNKTGINSYGLVVNGCDGVTIDGVTSVGGFSIGGDGDKGGTPNAAAATNVTIKNCNVTSGDWYTVCAQQNSTVTIESGVYTADSRSANSGVIQGTFKGSDGPKGTVTVTGGTFNGQIKNNDKGDIVIKGGTFNVDPSAYVPTEGYAAIEVETGKTWQVGEVKENNDGTTTTTATDTQTKVENGETLTTKTETVVVKNTDNSTTTAQAAETRDAGGNLKQTTYSAVEKDSSGNVTANVTATVESAKAPTTGKPSDALKSNTDADALAQRASNGIDPTNLDLTTDLMQSKAKEFADEALAELKQQQSQGGTDTNVDVKVDVTIKTTLTNYTVGSGDQSVTYNVSPILLAQVTVGSNAPVEKEKPIGNDKLKGSIPVRLPIPDSFATAVAGATTVQIKHIHGDGTSEIITGTIGGTTGGYYVDFSVTGFSSFQILPAGKSFPAPSTNTTTSGSGWSGWSGIGGGYSGSSNNGNSGNNAAQPNSQPVTIDEGGVPLSEFPLMFADVAENAWYRNAIAYVFREGLMKGVSDTKFGPADDTTRGMVSLILMRLADGEAPQTAITFSDVAIESWYADAASWAEMNKIFTGYADGTFRGDVAITREQLATVLYRYAAFCGLTLAEGADISAFGDKDAVSGYAVDAMRWAVAVGLFKGDDRGMLNPANHATRAELATVLMRFTDLFA